MFITRLILFIIGWAAGIAIIAYREKIARTFGKNDIAERYLGPGGTYTMWILIGIIIIIIGTLILLGKFAFLGL